MLISPATEETLTRVDGPRCTPSLVSVPEPMVPDSVIVAVVFALCERTDDAPVSMATPKLLSVLAPPVAPAPLSRMVPLPAALDVTVAPWT